MSHYYGDIGTESYFIQEGGEIKPQEFVDISCHLGYIWMFGCNNVNPI